jgi:uncharacterized MAPEG superfamily protein
MTFTISAILAAGVLPYVFLMVSGLPSRTERGRWGQGYDNRNARASLEQLTGWRKRAHFAQMNGHEAFPQFAAAMICAQLAGADVSKMHALAVGFIVFRVAHGAAYVANLGIPRSVLWGCAMACTVGLFVIALAASV